MLSMASIPMETSMTVPEIIELHGYSCQELTVTTTDGFQLSVFRVGKPEVTIDETDSEAEINEIIKKLEDIYKVLK